jgi:hypothetical protein
LSLLEDLAFIVANEGTLLMKTGKLSRYMTMRTGGSVRRARHASWVRTVRAQAMRGILVPALMLVSLGAGAAASPGHGIGGYVHASAHQPAHSLVLRANADSIKSCKIDNRIWWYAAISKMPWMYATIDKMPWMYAPTRMDAPQVRHASKGRVCLLAFPPGRGAHSQRS